MSFPVQLQVVADPERTGEPSPGPERAKQRKLVVAPAETAPIDLQPSARSQTAMAIARAMRRRIRSRPRLASRRGEFSQSFRRCAPLPGAPPEAPGAAIAQLTDMRASTTSHGWRWLTEPGRGFSRC